MTLIKRLPLSRYYIDSTFLLLTLFFWFLLIIGAIKGYSPVPYMDMWAAVDLYITGLNSNGYAWWAQHNEHRIIISRLLFWIDFKLFNGNGIFLIFINYFLLVSICAIYWIALRERIGILSRSLGLFIIIWLSSAVQIENLAWTFQSQFFLAYLIPLCSFFMLHKANTNMPRNGIYFFSAVLFGFLAIGTMANGILTLPLMLIFSIFARMRATFISCLIIATCLSLYEHTLNYHSAPHHGSFFDKLSNEPLGMIRYVLTYIGGPFYGLLGNPHRIIAEIAGTIFFLLTITFGIRVLRESKKSTLGLAMLFFIFFVVSSALATAHGRLSLGLDQALSSRYMTPALMAWAALYVIISPRFIDFTTLQTRKYRKILLIIIFLMIPKQLDTLSWGQENHTFEKSIAALALEIGVKDQKELNHISPNMEHLLSTGNQARNHGFIFYGHSSYRGVRELLGSKLPIKLLEDKSCHVTIQSSNLVNEQQDFYKIRGWFYNPSTKTVPSSLKILTKEAKLVGYAMTNREQINLLRLLDWTENKIQFEGYLYTDSLREKLIVVDAVNNCHASLTLSN